MHTLAIAVNAIVSLASASFAVMALIDSRRLSGSAKATTGEEYFARMYASRSIPLELLAGIGPIIENGILPSLLIVAAAIVQAADSLIGLRANNRGQIIGGSVAALLHLACATALMRL